MLLLARVVHASQRPAAGVRVGVWRRESAGARLGRDARLSDRAASDGEGRRRIPRARVSQIAHQLHLVGESQGRRRPQRLSRRLPRPRQHRRVQSERAVAGWRAARPERRHELDGDVLPQHAGHCPRAGAPATTPTRMSRPNSSSTSSTSRTRSTIGRTPRRPRPRHRRSVGQRRPVLLRPAAHARRAQPVHSRAVDGRPDPVARRGDDGRRVARQAA